MYFERVVAVVNDRFIGRCNQPAIGGNFVFQLPGGPAGIAKGDKILFRALANCQAAQNFEGCCQADLIGDLQGCFGLIVG